MSKVVKSSKKYDASSITVLEGLEGVRKKPGLYLGETDTNGITHLMKEVVGNSIDEATNGYGSNIAICIEKDTLTVFDGGRGIPVGKTKKNPKLDAMTAVATILHAGGKIDAKDGNYKTSLGTFGVGLSVVNALSTKLQIWSHRNGKVYTQSFSKGKPTSDVKPTSNAPKFNGKKWKHGGTIIQWTPDFSCFEKGSKTDPKQMVQWIKDSSWFIYALKGKKRIPVTFHLNVNGKISEFTSKSLDKYIEWRLKSLDKVEMIADTKLYDFTDICDFVGAWTTTPDMLFDTACNGAKTVDGGTHLKGAMKAMEDCFKKIAKKSQKFTASDLMAGFIGCFNVRVPSPQFDSQSKTRLKSPEAEKIAYEQVTAVVSKWIKKNKKHALKIVERAVALNATSVDNKLARQLASALATKKKGKINLPAGLTGSLTKIPDERELYIVEGDSAGGSCVKASDRKFQEILPLRGKILNVEKAEGSSKKGGLQESQPIIDILQSIGYNPKDIKAPLRVGKIMVMSDPDPDGPLHKDTKVKTDLGYITIEEMYQRYIRNEKPAIVLSRFKTGQNIWSSMIQISSREITNTYYEIGFSDGGNIKCTSEHKWPIKLDDDDPRKEVSIHHDFSALDFLPTIQLRKGDKVVSPEGYLEITSIGSKTGDWQDWYCGTVPMYGNFAISTGFTDIFTSNCHINALCLSVLWKTVPHLFDEGRIYVVNAPLYMYSTNHEKYYGQSLKELSNQVKGKFDHTKVTRIKGYGECSATDLKDIAFNEKTRSLTQVRHPRQFAQEVNLAMGNDSQYRKQLLGFEG